MEKRLFSSRLQPDWGNTAWAAMAGLGSIGLKKVSPRCSISQDLRSQYI